MAVNNKPFISRRKDPSDPSALYDDESTSDESYSRPAKQKGSARGIKEDRESKKEKKTHSRPEGVSVEMWAHAQRWRERGIEVLSKTAAKDRETVYPYVNLENFAVRFSEAVNSDRYLVGRGKHKGVLQTRGKVFLRRVVARMVEHFWDWILAESENDPEIADPGINIQRMFFVENWDGLVYRAIESTETKRIVEDPRTKIIPLVLHGPSEPPAPAPEPAVDLPEESYDDLLAVQAREALQNKKTRSNLLGKLEEARRLRREESTTE